jgi:hypothetical protein
MEEIIQAAIAEASSETSTNNFTSPSQPIRRDPAWKTHAMSRSAFSYYHTAEYAEELAEKHTRRAEKAVAKAKKKTVRGNPSARSNKAATEKVKRAEFSQSVAINWRRKADRYWRTELALKSAGVSRRRVRAAATSMGIPLLLRHYFITDSSTEAAENPPQPRVSKSQHSLGSRIFGGKVAPVLNASSFADMGIQLPPDALSHINSMFKTAVSVTHNSPSTSVFPTRLPTTQSPFFSLDATTPFAAALSLGHSLPRNNP